MLSRTCLELLSTSVAISICALPLVLPYFKALLRRFCTHCTRADASARTGGKSGSICVVRSHWSMSVAGVRLAIARSMTSFTSTVARLTPATDIDQRSEEHTSELQSHSDLVCRLLLEKKK